MYLAKAALNTLWAGLEWCFKNIREQRGNSVKTVWEIKVKLGEGRGWAGTAY